MKKLYMPVEWVGLYGGHYWVLKSKSVGQGSVVMVHGKYFNSVGEILKDKNNNQKGYDCLEAAQKAVEKHFEAKHIDQRINNSEVI